MRFDPQCLIKPSIASTMDERRGSIGRATLPVEDAAEGCTKQAPGGSGRTEVNARRSKPKEIASSSMAVFRRE